jgi:tRNA C32,U32 (ribose-2'-O)-methylase TrmJ
VFSGRTFISETQTKTKIRKMKKLNELYKRYFELQEELFEIQYSKDNWPKYMITSYEEMVNRVNHRNREVRLLALEIDSLKK